MTAQAVPLDLPPLERRTVPDLLDRSRTFGEDRRFFHDLASDRVLSYGEFLDKVAGAAGALSERFACGARIGVLAPNGAAPFVLRYALSCAGLVEVAVNGEHRGDVLRAMLEVTELDGLVVDERYLPHVTSCGYDTGSITVIGRDGLNEILDHGGSWSERPRPDIVPGDPARILFTSGTGSGSKGVELSHAYEVYTGQRHNGLLGIEPNDRWLYVTPLFHIDAIYIASILLHTGGCFVVAPNFSVPRFWRDVARSGATYLCYLGSLFALLMKGSDAPEDATLRVAVGGGASKELIDAVELRFGIRVLEAFAMTECIACTFNRIDDRRLGSVGRPIDGFDVAVVDDDGAPLPVGAAGEIVIRSDEPCGLFTRYVGDPDATTQAMRGGWFHTGDLGSLDSDGYMYYLGRMKDVVRRRGENISTIELETATDTHPDVSSSAAVGVPSDLGEEEILLYVEVIPGKVLDPKDLCTHLEARVAPFMLPLYIRIVDTLPRTQTQKIAKSELARDVDERTWRRRKNRAT